MHVAYNGESSWKGWSWNKKRHHFGLVWMLVCGVQKLQMNFIVSFFVKHVWSIFNSFYYKESVYDDEGNLLDEKPIDVREVERKKISTMRNKVEDLIQQARSSKEGMEFLVASIMNIQDSLGSIVPNTRQTRREEYESFISCQIPETSLDTSTTNGLI
jgi:hypothetical protein